LISTRSLQQEESIKCIQKSCKAVLYYARLHNYQGYGKHDALNSPLLKTFTFRQKWLRILCIQSIMRCPINIRPFFGVKTFRNPKGIALFVRSYFNMYACTNKYEYRTEAISLLDWLKDYSVKGYSGECWGYFWDWQDLGFFAPFGSPNCVVTTFVGQAFLDGYEHTGKSEYLTIARSAVDFILNDLKVLYEDNSMKCISYVPSKDITMAVMDVSALAGAFLARVFSYTGEQELVKEGRKMLNYVMDKQTEYGAWFYTEPPTASPVKIDNYHTGFILDTLLDYELATKDNRFRDNYRKGLKFYQENLFLPHGAPKWMSNKVYPFDIHGAGTGIGTFSRAGFYENRHYLGQALKIADWAIENMQKKNGSFYYQKRPWWTKRFILMRWCNAWMAHGLSLLMRIIKQE